MVNTREVALDCIMEILEKKQYSHYVIKQVLDKYGYLDKRERSFIKRTVEGTVERCMEMDYVTDSFSKVPVKKMKPFIRSLIRMSVYQILYMDSVPDSAVCNEGVKLAAKRGFGSLKGFVNGVLRNIVRNKEKIIYPDREKEPVSYFSMVYSMPVWIVELFISRFGEEKTEQILKALLSNRPLTIRLREDMGEEEKKALLQKMSDEGISFEKTAEFSGGYRLENFDRPESIPGFEEGLIMIQDAGSMAITDGAGVEENQYIIDVCGAPGGKALHAAGKMKNTGLVLVRDISERKVELIDENIKRSGCTNIRAEVFDATVLDRENIEKADLVIADLPCSGLGVIGRKGDIKYRITREDVAEVATLQRKILSVVWQYVRPGGKLLYSTCTLTEEENEKNSAWFLEQFPFKKEKEQLWIPGINETDGFYMAVFVRKAV